MDAARYAFQERHDAHSVAPLLKELMSEPLILSGPHPADTLRAAMDAAANISAPHRPPAPVKRTRGPLQHVQVGFDDSRRNARHACGVPHSVDDTFVFQLIPTSWPRRPVQSSPNVRQEGEHRIRHDHGFLGGIVLLDGSQRLIRQRRQASLVFSEGAFARLGVDAEDIAGCLLGGRTRACAFDVRQHKRPGGPDE